MFASIRGTLIAACSLLAIAASQAHAALSLTSLTHSEDFDFLASGGISGWVNDQTSGESTTGSPGWHWRGETGPYTASNSIATTGAPYSFGPTSNSDRAMGSLTTITNDFTAWGLVIQNNLSQPITELTVSFVGEKWRDGDLATDMMTFSYMVSSTNITVIDLAGGAIPTGWTARPALDVAFPNSGGLNGPVNGNDAANQFPRSDNWAVSIPVGEYLAIRWYDGNNPMINDHGIAIDDLLITVAVPEPSAFLFGGLVCGALSIGAVWQLLVRPATSAQR